MVSKQPTVRTNGVVAGGMKDQKTDTARWRMRDERGQQIWQYISSEEAERWPQSTAEKYHLGLPTGLPTLPTAKTPLQAARNGLSFFSELQCNLGNWTCEYGGPLFLLPGFVITWYVTNTPIPDHYSIEIRNYLFARQHPEDGGWGLHIEGDSSVFGTAMNYVVLRILGASAEDPRMIKARAMLHKLGGATNGPHWAKWWLSVLGVTSWDIVNPVPPELWLLPDWMPIAPWRWWIHMRQVFLPMSYIWSKKWVAPETELIRELRQELFVQPYESIKFSAHRNDIAASDNYNPKSWILDWVNFLLVWIWIPLLRTRSIVTRAEAWTWHLVQREDENTNYADLAPVNQPMNALCCYIHDGPDSDSFRAHLSHFSDFLWVKNEGMLANGTNGVQTWDTSFAIQAIIEAGLDREPEFKPTLEKALTYLASQQILDNVRDQVSCYRHDRKGAWGFSTAEQGYTVSDTTSEALKAVLMTQSLPWTPQLVSDDRIHDAVDVILSMQNAATGGVSSYEPARGSEHLELLNAAEVFGRIMVEYDYPECTTATVTALSLFTKIDKRYREKDIARFKHRAVDYIRKAQREDGSWYGSWGICFTYAGMFALESLASVGETFKGSKRVRRAVKFFLDRQIEDGGWGETYRSCETGVWCQHEMSQVVQTAWVVIGLIECGYDDREPLERAVRLLMRRQQANGEWLQESIEGVFNKSWWVHSFLCHLLHYLCHAFPSVSFLIPLFSLLAYSHGVSCMLEYLCTLAD